MTETVLDVLAAALLLGGSLLAFIAGLGIVRFPDLLSRMHAATKPQVLGLMLLMTGLGIELRNFTAGVTLLLVVAFQLVTGPISAHMLSRAAYRTGKVDSSTLLVDELTEDLARAAKLDELDRLELERRTTAARGED
ncbi:monovalent cation/H(+) antiporter subunit G [Georgenia wutianyii]|uniref:Monovalent cation/H(+) antiporter subunit G n=1 Tax=Georgenia wutianyii TaxID=2585135 RepID=A0ABX5VQL7_9MICO|nr:monovalent cation/H(+) antiporter subunit G [Georgenia wutianyii]QDB80493.1 monovalent cation/H(+) antiporter subunit G [Georgenia wutianyii]